MPKPVPDEYDGTVSWNSFSSFIFSFQLLAEVMLKYLYEHLISLFLEEYVSWYVIHLKIVDFMAHFMGSVD